MTAEVNEEEPDRPEEASGETAAGGSGNSVDTEPEGVRGEADVEGL